LKKRRDKTKQGNEFTAFSLKNIRLFGEKTGCAKKSAVPRNLLSRFFKKLFLIFSEQRLQYRLNNISLHSFVVW